MSAAWWILGSGAMGSLWAVQLQRAGIEVNVIRSPARKLEGAYCNIIYDGSIYDGSDTQATPLENVPRSSHKVRQYQAPNCPNGIERVLVCTKAYDVLDALLPLKPSLVDDADIVLLVNGMGFHDEVAKTFAQQNVFAAVTTVGAWLRTALHVVPAGDGETTVGALADSTQANSRSKGIADELSVGNTQVNASSNMREVLWKKVCINAAINGLTAIYQCRNGELLNHTHARPQLDKIIAELQAVSRAQSMMTLAAELEAKVHAVIQQTAANYSSSYQDVKQGRKTEIDYINGYVSRLAAGMDIETPHNDAVVEAIHALTNITQATQK